jgi:uncharacterized protein involved in exopolysaccharide biosynthesis
MQRKNWIIIISITGFLGASLLAISSPTLYSGSKSSCSKKKTEKNTQKPNIQGDLPQDNLSSQFIFISRGF